MVLKVKDIWHPHINGDIEPWIYSDDEKFESIEDFLRWVGQHTHGKLDGVVIHLY